MKAKKSLGQHFLRSERALSSIVDAAELSPHDTVLEIGPGQGVLTEKLLSHSLQVIAVEKDDGLYEFLKERFGEEIGAGKLILVHEDILDYKLPTTTYKLVANIPYNITGAILKKFLSADHQPQTAVLLIQREVAQRIVARDGKESILSLSVKAYGRPRYVEMVRAGSFSPVPKVDSAILAVEDISKEFFEGFSEQNFFSLVRAGFSSKRKKLATNLQAIFEKDKIGSVFSRLELDSNTRAEDVPIETWQKLAQILLI